ncbi:hypothetical protein Gogos_013643, partial [Gossypium gossypioides]|nr:hypothetical protein [Gossypium gossypioides]
MLKFATDIFVVMSVVKPRLVRGPRWIKWTKLPQRSYILDTNGARDSLDWRIYGEYRVDVQPTGRVMGGFSRSLSHKILGDSSARGGVRCATGGTVRHIHREGSSCAYHLANLAQNIERGLVCLETLSARLKPLLHSDSCGEG